MIDYIKDNIIYIIFGLIILLSIRKLFVEHFTHLPEWSNDLKFYKLKQNIPECPIWDYSCRAKNGSLTRDLYM